MATHRKFVYVYGEPGRDKLLLCASPHLIYPDAENCTWTTDMAHNYDNDDPSISLDPFVLDAKSQIVYHGKADDILAAKKIVNDGAVALKMEGDYWKFSGEMCYIAAKNIGKAPISLTISAKGTCFHESRK